MSDLIHSLHPPDRREQIEGSLRLLSAIKTARMFREKLLPTDTPKETRSFIIGVIDHTLAQLSKKVDRHLDHLIYDS